MREAGQKQRSSFEFRFALVVSRTQSGVDDNQECKRALGSDLQAVGNSHQ